MISDIQAAIILFGAIAVCYPLVWAFIFWPDHNGIGRRISYMLLGEGVSMAAALFFAVNSYLNLYNSISPWVSAGLRILIFATALLSTVMLIRHLRRTTKGNE